MLLPVDKDKQDQEQNAFWQGDQDGDVPPDDVLRQAKPEERKGIETEHQYNVDDELDNSQINAVMSANRQFMQSRGAS